MPLEGIRDYVDIDAVVNGWQALVVIFAMFCLLIWPGIVSMMNRRSMKDIKKTLTENNGGSSVKDALDSIKSVQAEHGKTLTDHITWSEGYRKATDTRLTVIESTKKHGLFGH